MTDLEVLQALEELGMTAEEVAASLRREGVKGNQRKFRSCPLAVFLQKKFSNAKLSVGTVSVYCDDMTYLEVELPQGAHAFRRRFDNGEFLDLVSE